MRKFPVKPLAQLATAAVALEPAEFAAAHGTTFLLFMPLDPSRVDSGGMAKTRHANGPAAQRPSDPSAFLVCAIDPLSGPEAVLIGRAPFCDVVITDDSVSAEHCYLCRQAEKWVVYDAKSTNGTWINEVGAPALSSGERGIPIESMARVRLGGFEATILEADQIQRLAQGIREQ